MRRVRITGVGDVEGPDVAQRNPRTGDCLSTESEIRMTANTAPLDEYDRDEARVQLAVDLRALGVPRLDAEDILTAIRPNIPWPS
jgi:hypothetical protein